MAFRTTARGVNAPGLAVPRVERRRHVERSHSLPARSTFERRQLGRGDELVDGHRRHARRATGCAALPQRTVCHPRAANPWLGRLEGIARAQGRRIAARRRWPCMAAAKRGIRTNPTWGAGPGEDPELHASCLPFIRDHDVSLLVWDMMDAAPNGYDDIAWSVHGVIFAYGVWPGRQCPARAARRRLRRRKPLQEFSC